MDPRMPTFDAIVFPADDRPPSIVPLMVSAVSLPAGFCAEPYRSGHAPHPEIYMDSIDNQLGSRAWRYHLIEALDGMLKKFSTPYILFYPVISCDGLPFPVNKCIREIQLQAQTYNRTRAWRGNLVIAKYRADYSAMIDASMADFPIIKNYMFTHLAPS